MTLAGPSRRCDPRGLLRYAAGLGLLVALSACASPPPASTSSSASATVPAVPTTAPSAAAGTSSSPPTTAMGRRCGRPDVEASAETIAGPEGATLVLSAVGSGGTVALLLHQTGPSASCGWWPFANHMAQNGIRAVMMDFCGFGRSTCDTAKPWAVDYVDQVVRAVAHLRSAGATRVTVVGASLGGTVASVSAARAGADAVVNLSGFGLGAMVTGPSLAALRIPLLGAGSHAEESDSVTLESQVQTSSSPARRFVWSEAGHGWSLVLDGPFPESSVSAVGRTVIAWVKGDYAG